MRYFFTVSVVPFFFQFHDPVIRSNKFIVIMSRGDDSGETNKK